MIIPGVPVTTGYIQLGDDLGSLFNLTGASLLTGHWLDSIYDRLCSNISIQGRYSKWKMMQILFYLGYMYVHADSQLQLACYIHSYFYNFS